MDDEICVMMPVMDLTFLVGVIDAVIVKHEKDWPDGIKRVMERIAQRLTDAEAQAKR